MVLLAIKLIRRGVSEQGMAMSRIAKNQSPALIFDKEMKTGNEFKQGAHISIELQVVEDSSITASSRHI